MDWTFDSPTGQDILHFQKLPGRLRAQLVSISVGAGTYFPEIKRSEREADHSLPYSAEVKNKLNYTSSTPYTVIACTEATQYAQPILGLPGSQSCYRE